VDVLAEDGVDERRAGTTHVSASSTDRSSVTFPRTVPFQPTATVGPTTAPGPTSVEPDDDRVAKGRVLVDGRGFVDPDLGGSLWLVDDTPSEDFGTHLEQVPRVGSVHPHPSVGTPRTRDSSTRPAIVSVSASSPS
jgi:hypothetical protein